MPDTSGLHLTSQGRDVCSAQAIKNGLSEPEHYFNMTCTQSAILGQPATKFSRHFVTVEATDWINFSSVLLPVLYIWIHVRAAQKERWFFEGTIHRIFLGISVKATWTAQSTASFYALNTGAKALTAFIFGQTTTHIYNTPVYWLN